MGDCAVKTTSRLTDATDMTDIYRGPDRRGQSRERRGVVDRRSGMDRRRGPGRRRGEVRKAAEEGEIGGELLEFIMAIDEYKRVNERPFPAWSEVFEIMQYLGALKAPDSPYLPTHWVAETLWDYLSGSPSKNHLFGALFVWSTAAFLVVINIWVAEAIYFEGFSKSQEAKKRRRGGNTFLDLLMRLFTRPMGRDLGSVISKDIRTFFRDNTQWSQLLLLGALVIVYLYNFSVLPLDRSPMRIEFLQNEIAFLNMGLAGFVLSAVSVRFIFPAVSSEGGAFWIIRSSPLPIKRFLWGKYAFYILPMIILGEVLIIITNYLLNVSTFMMILSSVTMLLTIFGIVALGIGFGALYPNFKFESIAQVTTGFGGVMYMIVSVIFLALIIVLEAGPVYVIFMANVKGVSLTGAQWLFIIPSFAAVLIIGIWTVYKPMKMGLEALRQYE